jgi:23S rRNA (cytosine1962-C5)-methyltransferase
VSPTGEPTAVIAHRGEERVRAGHPWIYRSDLVSAEAAGGEVVAVMGPRRRVIGHAFFSDSSEIALRMVSLDAARPDEAFWRRRLDAALRYRESLAIDATAYRLVHAEGDQLPSLIVDRYGDHLVVQALSQATDRLLPAFVRALQELATPAGILARNDSRVRTFEGLDRRVDVVAGAVPDRVAVREGKVRYEVDLRHGQKTGLFLDQRENRRAAAAYASGRALDCFSYHGGFALHMAATAREVVALDISEEAVAALRQDAAANGLANIEARAVNVFDALREMERAGERFDIVVLDPPAFAKNRASVPKARAGYKEINLRALKLLRPGGFLVTCSCSYHIDEAAFGQIVYEAAVDAHAPVVVVEKRMQGRDHPVVLGVPETYYLKCFVLRKLPA